MKHLSALCLALLVAGAARAQCPGCTATNCAATNPDGGLCDTILIGMANHPMDEQISFYAPTSIYTTLLPGGGYVQLDKIKITGVVGLPLGLNWEANHSPANEYFPQTGDSIGCVRVCGTPIQADTFRLTVYLLADVTAPIVGQVKNNQQTYNNAVVIILPDTSGGVASFSIDPNIKSSCDPLTLTFEGKIDGSPNRTDWDWDFGNGNTGTGKNPGSQTYSTPGDYPVSLTTTIYNYVITQVRVFDVNNSYTGDIEELTTLQNPDLYFNIPVLGYTSSVGSDSRSQTWSGLHIVVPQGTTEIELRVWDKDNGPPFGSQDDSLARVTVNLAIGTFLWNDGSGTATNGVIVIGDTVGNVFTETLDIEIGEKPVPAVTTSAGDSICGGDSTILTLAGSGIYQFTWFKDSVFIAGAVDTFLNVKTAGVYWAEVTSQSGCTVVSDPRPVRVFPYPPAPSVYFSASSNLLYTTNASHVALIRWYQNGVEVAGANDYKLTATDTGHYTVEYSNALGCATVSEPFAVTDVTGVNDLPETTVLIHPNPNDGKFQLEIGQAAAALLSILITDAQGKMVYSEDAAGNNVFNKTFSLPELKAGMYFVRVLSGKSQRVEKMLIMR